MKRQKRNPISRAHARGYLAGLNGRSRDICPYQEIERRESWLSGWREAKTTVQTGIIESDVI